MAKFCGPALTMFLQQLSFLHNWCSVNDELLHMRLIDFKRCILWNIVFLNWLMFKKITSMYHYSSNSLQNNTTHQFVVLFMLLSSLLLELRETKSLTISCWEVTYTIFLSFGFLYSYDYISANSVARSLNA